MEYNKTDSIICSYDEVLIKDIISIISDCYKFNGQIIYDTTKSDGCIKKTASNKYFLSLFPDFKFTELKDGINETVEWFINNYNSGIRI